MKIFQILVILHAFQLPVKSQDSALTGIWHSKKQDLIEFAADYCTVQNGINFNETGFTICRRSGKDLVLLSEYQDPNNIDLTKIDNVNQFRLRVKLQTADSIILAFTSKKARRFFNGRHEIKFYRQKFFKDTSIKFSKLVFRAGECFGNCPILALQINEKGSIQYDGSGNTDKSLDGSFSGTISGSDLDTLVNLLQNCQLKTLKWHPALCCDAPVITLIIYYSGARKYLRSMVPASISSELVSFLYRINSKAVLSRRNHGIEFEE